MGTQRERAENQRRLKLEAVAQQVEDGSLTIRQMTPEESRSTPSRWRRAPSAAARMTAFFVPGTPVGEQADRAYEDLRDRAESTPAARRASRRIYRLSCRRGGADCETAVGEHDLGGRDRARDLRRRRSLRDLLAGGHEIVTKRQTYAVVEFDA